MSTISTAQEAKVTMRINSIKTIFHVLGAVLSIFGFLLLLLATGATRAPVGALVIVFSCALLIGGLGLYMLAGANRWSEAIHRRLPSEGSRRQRIFQPRHKFKAPIGISLGAITCGILALLPLQPESYQLPESLDYVVFPLLFLGPLAGIYGAIHLAWHRGQRPTLALLPVGMGVIVMLLSPLLGVTLAVVGPTVVILTLPRRPG
jgi:hypothetical protein